MKTKKGLSRLTTRLAKNLKKESPEHIKFIIEKFENNVANAKKTLAVLKNQRQGADTLKGITRYEQAIRDKEYLVKELKSVESKG